MADRWELMAARTGGTVAALATAVAADGTNLVFAATAAGLHRSADGGRTWTTVSAGAIPPPVEVVAPSPGFARDRTLFVGTGRGLYRSSDGGESWRWLLTGSRVIAIALSPSYAGDSLLFAGTETDGILRSEDGGQTWASANPGLLDLTVLALALSQRFEEDRTGFAATASGLYRTRNGGRSWREVELPIDEPAVQCLAISPSFPDDRLLLAGTEADGLLRSDDAGASWEVVPALAHRAVTALAFSSRYPARPRLAAATAEGVALSDDGGRSWRLPGEVAADRPVRPLGPVLSLASVPAGDGEVLLAGLPQRGAARLIESRGWLLANDGLNGNLLVALALSPDFARDGTLFTAGLEDGVAASTDGGATWEACNAGLGDTTVFGLAVCPRYASDRTLYAATARGIYLSRDGAATLRQAIRQAQARAQDRLWRPADGGGSAAARVVAVGPASGDEPAPVLAALRDGGLLASDDGGATWRRLAWAFGDAELVSLALSPGYAQDRTIFAGTTQPASDGAESETPPPSELVLWRSTDGGQRWRRWLVTRGPNVLPLAISPGFPIDETVFVGVGGRVMKPLRDAQEIRAGERRPIWRGVELTRQSVSVTALAASPNYCDDATVFAATGAGVYVSRDAGASFTRWSEGLASAAVVALAISPDYGRDRLIYALGLGGTIWRRRDRF